MYKAIHNLKEQKGFTLIELLIVVAIIGILVAVSVPAYIGVQRKGRIGAVERAVASQAPELQGYLVAARRGGIVKVVDTNNNGILDDDDLTNDGLTGKLNVDNGLCQVFIDARTQEKSPWYGDTPLWNMSAANGTVTCTHSSGSSITLSALDGSGYEFIKKTISAD